ncbi:glutathione S-transferase T2-like [Chenopodium quinoa]|uniref:glutathione S-transferase T2-like n=1 Tax=Chenopodium quinoa TaxID=63459 RepID=UPI000B78B989|nr:glutathione S-transferase T2-like [Chenopodium quinoa]
MSQHVGNQVENSPTTPGGDGSSNKTPPERNVNDDENDDDDVDGEDLQDSNTTSSNAKWGAQEDDALVSAWIECANEDPETTTDQRLAMMWKSIYDLYEQARKDNSSTIRRRTLRAMKGRWGRINKDVSLWVGCYAAAQRRNASGTNTYNVMTEAQEMYSASCNGAQFTLISIWDVLKKSDKWRLTNKQVPNTSESDSSKSSDPDTPTEAGRRGRPDGVKKAKRKDKSVASSGISSLDSFTQALLEMNVMKEQYKSVDEKRADVAQQMLDYQKERDVEKKKRKRGIFDYMVNDYVEWHESITQRRKEEELIEEAINSAVVPLVTSTFQVPFTPNPKKQRWYVPRDREDDDTRLYNDYFSPKPLYNDDMFRRRFRMRKHVFTRIVEELSESNEYFRQRADATRRLGASSFQKCTAAMRMLAYVIATDAVDEYLKIAASTARDCLQHFVEGVNC